MILTVNAGSSSARLALFDSNGVKVSAEHLRAVPSDPGRSLEHYLSQHPDAGIVAVAHRVVHGGAEFRQATLVDATVEDQIDRLARLAPLHNPPALAWLRACRARLGAGVPQIAVFDTGFFAGLPPVASSYALPRELCERHAIRRYGFHGIAHRALYERFRALCPQHATRIVTFQLGSGCSAAALRDGAPIDTSMGFSPLEGLVMATRAGDLDPGIVTHLQREEGWDIAQTELVLSGNCGLQGLTGRRDMRELLGATDSQAQLAVELFSYRARKYLGAYAAALGGLDAVVFGGGIGEHAPVIRARILEGMDWCGIAVDKAANDSAVAKEACITATQSRVTAWVIPVDEAAVLAAEAQRFVAPA